MIEYLYSFSLSVLIATLVYASFTDIRSRTVKFKTWIPSVIVGSISTITYLYYNVNSIDPMINLIVIASVVIFFALGWFRFMGGADAWALIFVSIFTVPFTQSVFAPDGIGVSVYFNAIIVVLIFYPIYNLIKNWNIDAPIYYKILSLRIEGKDILKNYGYIIDSDEFKDVRDRDAWYGEGTFEFLDFFGRYSKPSELEFTKWFIDEPKKYKGRIDEFMVQKNVWLLNAVPFVAFITIGLIITFVVGDLFNMALGLNSSYNMLLGNVINATALPQEAYKIPIDWSGGL